LKTKAKRYWRDLKRKDEWIFWHYIGVAAIFGGISGIAHTELTMIAGIFLISFPTLGYVSFQLWSHQSAREHFDIGMTTFAIIGSLFTLIAFAGAYLIIALATFFISGQSPNAPFTSW